MGRRGTELRSVVPGTVVSTYGSAGNSYTEIGGYNVMVESSVDVGPIKKGDSFYYAHMDNPPAVSPGDTVTAGQKLGEMGSTGYGPEVTSDQMPVHLHFGWYTDPARAEAASGAKNPYDLLNWLAQNGGAVTGTDPGATAVASVCPPPSLQTGDGAPLATGEPRTAPATRRRWAAAPKKARTSSGRRPATSIRPTYSAASNRRSATPTP